MDSQSLCAVLVIFGAAGDLTWRKLVPALYSLYLDKWTPPRFAVIGVDRKSLSDEEFRSRLREGVDAFSRRGKTDDAEWTDFAAHFTFAVADFGDSEAFASLARQLDERDKEWDAKANRIFYLATPPRMMESITEQLGRAGLAGDGGRVRMVVEKPFGRDLQSAKALNQMLTADFRESQIYRIDHYLGKETVQNILALRFANAFLEPIWDRRYIDHVQITVAEEVGIEHRGDYYDHAGALRDMVQNHLLQILCMIAMEPPVSFEADEIRNKKVDVLRAIRPIHPEEVHQCAVRGQYGMGWIQGQRVQEYRREPGVSVGSFTETFAALKLFVDNWRWQDVPFYLRTGKRLPFKSSEVVIVFRPVPHRSFPASAVPEWKPNELLIRIQPREGILLSFQAKQPGPTMSLGSVNMNFNYKDTFKAEPPEAYETLLWDILRGDATQFMRADQVEAAWSIVTPILQVWEAVAPVDFPNYYAGSWGPEAASILLARDGRSWVLPACFVGDNEGEASA